MNVKVLLPYPGPDSRPCIQDIFVYMRPETNGMVGESAIGKVIEQCPEYRTDIRLIYMANLPGTVINGDGIMESHYATKLHFARTGKRAFTEYMRSRFSEYFGESFQSAPIVGAFEAIERLGISHEELFTQWVQETDMLTVDGQTIKRMRGYYVVNYDMPALIRKYDRYTDIAVMLFRVAVAYDYLLDLVEKIRRALTVVGLLGEHTHASRAFHYSKGPFEQIQDGMGYLFNPNGQHIDISRLSFARFLLDRGIPLIVIEALLRYPLGRFRERDGTAVEDSIFSYTQSNSYEESYRKLLSMTSQYRLVL